MIYILCLPELVMKKCLPELVIEKCLPELVMNQSAELPTSTCSSVNMYWFYALTQQKKKKTFTLGSSVGEKSKYIAKNSNSKWQNILPEKKGL